MALVLVVDDSDDLQDSYELVLTAEGYDVAKASDGAAALQLVEELHPDVVLLDMMMPDVDGLEFLQRMPQECSRPHPSVVANSGYESYREEALRRGAHAFLSKPAELDVLRAAIASALAHAPLAAEVVAHNQDDVAAARARSARETGELVAHLAPDAFEKIKGRLRALASWLPRYYGFGAVFINIVRDQDLCIEAACSPWPLWHEGELISRERSYCGDVIDAGSTAVLTDPLHHPVQHFSAHQAAVAGVRFYAGVPLTTSSGVVVGTLCMLDVEPHPVHAEDMRLLETLGLRVARGLEQMANGAGAEDFILDDQALFSAELLPLFLESGIRRAARNHGVVGVARVRVGSEAQAHAVARACYEACPWPGLVAVRRDAQEVVLIEIGDEADAARILDEAVAICRRTVAVQSVGSAWCTVTAEAFDGQHGGAIGAIGAHLLAMAAEASSAGLAAAPTTPVMP
jgi:CheY-like chemotaxis protein